MVWPLTGKKRRVLRSSGQLCEHDCWHTGLSRLKALAVNLSRPPGLLCYYYVTWVQLRRLHSAQGDTYPPPLLQMAGHGGGHRERKNSQQETDQTVLTITKAHTNTTNCTFRAKKVEGHDQKIFSSALCWISALPPFCARSVPSPPLSNSFWRHCLGLTLACSKHQKNFDTSVYA